MAAAELDDRAPYRDPRKAFGNNQRPLIPVGEATDLTGIKTPQDIGAIPGGAPNTGPQTPGGMQPNTGPQQPAGSLADKIRGAAGQVNDINARQTAAIKAPIDAASRGLQTAGAGVRNVANSIGELGSAVANNPLVKYGAAPIAGAVGAVSEASNARDAMDRGDTASAVDSGARGIASGALLIPGAGQALGGAYLAGQGIGGVIDAGLRKFAPGFRDKIGSLFASSEDRAKVAAAEDFARGGSGAVAPAAQTSAALPPQQVAATGATASNAADMAVRRGNARDVAANMQDIAAPPPSPAGTITYDPKTKTYSGTNIQAGADIAGARNPTAGVTVLPGGGAGGFGPGSSVMQDDALRTARFDAAARGDFAAIDQSYGKPASGPTFIGIGGAGTTTISDDLRAKTNAGRTAQMPSGLSARGKARFLQQQDANEIQRQGQALQRDNSAQQIAAQMRGQDIGYAGQQLSVGTQARGQDIGAVTARYGADESASARRDVSQENHAARVEAAKERTSMPKVVGGGSHLEAAPDGTFHVIQDPARMVHPVTGEEIGAKPAKQSLQATAARIAIRDDPKMTREQKIAKLKELDAQGSR